MILLIISKIHLNYKLLTSFTQVNNAPLFVKYSFSDILEFYLL